MSRISEALARAEHRSRERTDAVPNPWDLGDVPVKDHAWDFTDQAGTLPALTPPKPVSPVSASEVPAKTEALTAPPPARPLPPAIVAPRPQARSSSAEYAGKLLGTAGLPQSIVEQYRRLGATLYQAQATSGTRVVMVTSAMPGEGKTLLASNLALVLSGSYGFRVLLLDADLRRPSVHSVFGTVNAPGLADRLVEERAVEPIAVSPTLDVLPAGTPQSDPMRIVTSNAMRRLVDECRQRYDWLIIDTPPVALLPDAHLLAMMADRALLVVQAGKTPYEAVQKAVATIGKERLLGTVLNRADVDTANPYGGDYEQYLQG